MILYEMGMLTFLQDDDNTVEGSDIPEVDPSGRTYTGKIWSCRSFSMRAGRRGEE